MNYSSLNIRYNFFSFIHLYLVAKYKYLNFDNSKLAYSNRRYTYSAMVFIFDRMSPAYSFTKAFSTSRSFVSFTQVSVSTHSPKTDK